MSYSDVVSIALWTTLKNCALVARKSATYRCHGSCQRQNDLAWGGEKILRGAVDFTPPHKEENGNRHKNQHMFLFCLAESPTDIQFGGGNGGGTRMPKFRCRGCSLGSPSRFWFICYVLSGEIHSSFDMGSRGLFIRNFTWWNACIKRFENPCARRASVLRLPMRKH